MPEDTQPELGRAIQEDRQSSAGSSSGPASFPKPEPCLGRRNCTANEFAHELEPARIKLAFTIRLRRFPPQIKRLLRTDWIRCNPKVPVAGLVMSVFNLSDRISPMADRPAASLRLTPLLFAATLFVSALLLFVDPADVCQDGAAEARRRAGGVVGRDGVLPDRVAGRLCLRPSVAPRAAATLGGGVPSRAARLDAPPRCRSRSRPDGPRRRRKGPRSGCSGCLPSRSACRSSRCRRTRRCCRTGSRRAGTGRRVTLTCSMRHPTSVRSPHCSPIPSSSNRS